MLYRYSNKFRFCLLLFFGLIASFQNIVAAYMVQTLTNIGTQRRWGEFSNFFLTVVCGLLIVLVASLIFNRLKTSAVQEANSYLRKQIFKGMLASDDPDLGFLTNDFKLLETNRFEAEIDIFMQAFNLLLALGYALTVNWLITLIFLIGSLVPMVISNFFQKPIQKASQAWTRANSKYVDQTKNFLAGNKTLVLYHGENQAARLNQEKIMPLERALRKMNLLNLDTTSWIQAIANIVSFLIPFTIGIYLVINNLTSLGAIFAIVQLSNSFVNPILIILDDRNKLSTTKKIAEKVDQLAKAKDKPKLANFTGFSDLKVNDLTLTRKDQKLVQNLSFCLKSGQKLAVIGPSGSGKSTLLQYLLSGKYGQAKNIQLNGQEVAPGKFTDLFAYASQAPVIFADTLWFNLTLGKNISQEIVTKTCDQLGLSDIIREKGFTYQMGNRADKLSGGQLARIELARAILANRPVLLLDEINASLDRNTSDVIHDYLLNSNLTFIEVIHHYENDDLRKYDQVIDLNEYLDK